MPKEAKKHRHTWKWVVDDTDGFGADYYLLCPHLPLEPGESILVESKTFRKEKFLLLTRLEVARWEIKDADQPAARATEFCDRCRSFSRKLESD